MKSRPALPDVRGDRLELGFTGSLKDGSKLSKADLDERWRSISRITTPASRRYDGYTQLTLDLETDQDNPAGMIRVELHFKQDGPDLRFGDRCAIRMNGLDMLRGELGPDMCGELSFDGKTNVLGVQHRGTYLTALQLGLIEQALQYVLDGFVAAFGDAWRPADLWLKSGEACRDTSTHDAIADVRIIQHVVLVGTVERRWDEYRRIGGSETNGIPVLRFVSRAMGPEDKIYPKRDDTWRAELACSSRSSVVALTGALRMPFTAEAGRELILHFLTAAEPRIERIVTFVRDALRGEASAVDLLLQLKPLIDRAAGERKGKGPASIDAQRVATRAVEALLSVGYFDGGGLPAQHAIRRELDALRKSDGPLEKHPTRVIYYLVPRLARACGSMRWKAVR